MQARQTIAAAIDEAEAALRKAGCHSPKLDAEQMLAAALEIDPANLGRPDNVMSRASEDKFRTFVHRRVEREPLAYILRRAPFRGFELLVDERVIIPDPTTAVLVDVAIELPLNNHVHEVGTGCGAVALAIKRERPDLSVSASDISPEALEVALENRLQLQIAVDFGLADGLPPGHYDLVVANMPYLDTGGAAMPLPAEYTRYQPNIAVYAGTDGLAKIRHLVATLPAGQRVALQHAPSQAEAVAALLTEAKPVNHTTDIAAFTIGRARG